MGHGFDDPGSRSDGSGMLRDWWTKDSREHFDAQARVLVDQFNAYEPIAGTRIKGELTLGENIGDLGGMAIAYEAYRMNVDQAQGGNANAVIRAITTLADALGMETLAEGVEDEAQAEILRQEGCHQICPLYTSDAADDLLRVDLGGRRLLKKKKMIRLNTRTLR